MPTPDAPDTADERVVVVGGGITGLVTARRLAEGGTPVLLLERAAEPGGQIRTVPFAGTRVDVGAESLHPAAPGTSDLLDALGLTASSVRAAPGSASLWIRDRLRPLPAGVGPTGPTQLWPVVRSGLLSVRGLLRAALEPVMARRRVEGDVSVGDLLDTRFGREVVDRFVDPLLGSLHAGDVRRLSLVATAPQLVPAAREGRSLVLARRRRGAGGPGFASWPGGMTTLVAALSDARVEVRTSTEVTEVRPVAGGVEVVTSDGTLGARAVVLAVPARDAAVLVRPHAPEAADLLAGVRTASVATVLARYPRGALPTRSTGLLVPSTAGRLLKAATVLSTKWPHLADGDVLVRLSAGRAGDDDVCTMSDDSLATRLHQDLADLLGVRAEPLETLVHRWPGALPQLEVGHPGRVAAARAELDPRGILLAGASYDGLGLAACIRAGHRAAQQAADHRVAVAS